MVTEISILTGTDRATDLACGTLLCTGGIGHHGGRGAFAGDGGCRLGCCTNPAVGVQCLTGRALQSCAGTQQRLGHFNGFFDASQCLVNRQTEASHERSARASPFASASNLAPSEISNALGDMQSTPSDFVSDHHHHYKCVCDICSSDRSSAGSCMGWGQSTTYDECDDPDPNLFQMDASASSELRHATPHATSNHHRRHICVHGNCSGSHGNTGSYMGRGQFTTYDDCDDANMSMSRHVCFAESGDLSFSGSSTTASGEDDGDDDDGHGDEDDDVSQDDPQVPEGTRVPGFHYESSSIAFQASCESSDKLFEVMLREPFHADPAMPQEPHASTIHAMNCTSLCTAGPILTTHIYSDGSHTDGGEHEDLAAFAAAILHGQQDTPALCRLKYVGLIGGKLQEAAPNFVFSNLGSLDPELAGLLYSMIYVISNGLHVSTDVYLHVDNQVAIGLTQGVMETRTSDTLFRAARAVYFYLVRVAKCHGHNVSIAHVYGHRNQSCNEMADAAAKAISRGVLQIAVPTRLAQHLLFVPAMEWWVHTKVSHPSAAVESYGPGMLAFSKVKHSSPDPIPVPDYMQIVKHAVSTSKGDNLSVGAFSLKCYY